MRVLYVEDDEDARDVLAAALAQMGHLVVSAANVSCALAALSCAPDVVITDLTLPEADGWEVARRVKAQCPLVPVLLLTGWGNRVGREEARRRGVDVILAKPVAARTLFALLDDLHERATRCAALAHEDVRP